MNFIAKHLFKLVTEKDVLRDYKGQLFYKGEALSPKQTQNLIYSAKELKSNSYFRMLMEEMFYEINKQINEANTLESFRTTKSMLWTVDMIARKVDNMSKRQ